MRFDRAAALVLILAAAFYSCSNDERNDVFTGVIEGTMVQVPALTGGKIVALYADTGDRVAGGQMLAQVDTTDLVYQRMQLEAASTEVDVQEEIAATALERAKADLDYVRQRYERVSSLLEGGAVTEQAVDDARIALRNAESAYETASQQARTVKAKAQSLSAQLSSVGKRIRDASVAAPIGGTVTGKYYEAGEAVPQLRPIFEILETEEVWVKIYVGEERLPSLKVGQTARIRASGLEKPLPGTVAWISPEAEFTPKQILTPEVRTSLVYAVKVIIDNEEGILKHGMPVEVRLE
jgi:HlyD family secretion protein